MKRNWKRIRLAALLAVASAGAGCSGIHASKSVSPLDFILPGLIQNDVPPPHDVVPKDSPGVLLVQAR